MADCPKVHFVLKTKTKPKNMRSYTGKNNERTGFKIVITKNDR